jgi:hypothetical protein
VRRSREPMQQEKRGRILRPGFTVEDVEAVHFRRLVEREWRRGRWRFARVVGCG